MIFKNFRLNVLVRVILLCGLSLVFAAVLTQTGWFFTPLVIGILILLITINLITYLEKTNKDLTNFLLSIKQGGFTSIFTSGHRGSKYGELSEAFNEVIAEFQKLNIEKESHYQYLQTVNENIGVALISFSEDGNIEMINNAAKNLLQKPYLTNIRDLEKIDSELYKVAAKLNSGEKEMVKTSIGGHTYDLSVQAKEFVVKDKNFKLILMQNLKSELEQKEVEAWQKLISVLTHEIMNSVTPIVSLTNAINSILNTEDGHRRNISEIHEEDIEDIYLSLKTIENRSKGLVKFVNAYKDFSKTLVLKPSYFDLIQLIKRIEFLLKPDLEKKEIMFGFHYKVKKFEVFGDQELIEQVLINLLKNAIEALTGKPNGAIDFRVIKGDHNKAKIEISDNGQGIDSDAMEKIFVPFYTTKKHGTGIGLSLSQQVLKLHGGSIYVRSEVDKGTTFSLEF